MPLSYIKEARMKVSMDELYEGATWKGAAAELIATLLFVFIGAGAVVSSGIVLGGKMDAARLVAISAAHGLAIFIFVSASAPISGGFVNPAMAFAAWVAGKISVAKLLLFIVAQLAGAAIAAFLLKAIFPSALQMGLGAHAINSANLNGAGAGFVVELVLTFALAAVVLMVAIDKKGLSQLAPLAIGFTVFAIHLIAVPLTGASVNPARTFGPAWASGNWDHHWLYWVAPLLGAGLAALVYKNVFESKD